MNKFTLESSEIQKKALSGSQITKGKKRNYDMLVFCHLRWGFVYQRPQHIISRLSEKYSILFIEEPIPFAEGEEYQYDIEEISSTLDVLKPKVHHIQDISKVLKTVLGSKSIDIGWFYSSSFSVLIPDFAFGTVIYDCMDELSLFKGAAKELIDQEKFLLAEAEIVFTGGRALYESKVETNPNVHCFPSSVDQKHFEKALTNIPVPEDIKNIPNPIVGYFGVIDERIDLDLLYKTALLLPDISFVMIGPLAKIGEEDLPRASNIHYLGMKSYNELPNYLKVFDIAMMPFALNDATKFISPTKTLEYMAAKVPIISTAIKDVVRYYEHCIPIIDNPEGFKAAILDILNHHPENLTKHYASILANTSWDATVDKMGDLIKQWKI